MSDIVCIKPEVGDGDAAMWRALYEQRGEEIEDLENRIADSATPTIAESLAAIAESLATLASCVSEQDATYHYLRTQAGG